jgi:hypothetical protein
MAKGSDHVIRFGPAGVPVVPICRMGHQGGEIPSQTLEGTTSHSTRRTGSSEAGEPGDWD